MLIGSAAIGGSIIGMAYASSFLLLLLCFTVLTLSNTSDNCQCLCIAYSASGPAYSALLPDIVPLQQRGRVTKTTTALGQIGAILGSIGSMVSKMLKRLTSMQSLEVITMKELLFGLASIMLTACIVTCFSICSTSVEVIFVRQCLRCKVKPFQKDGKVHNWRNMVDPLRHSSFCWFLLSVFFFNCGDTILQTFLQVATVFLYSPKSTTCKMLL